MDQIVTTRAAAVIQAHLRTLRKHHRRGIPLRYTVHAISTRLLEDACAALDICLVTDGATWRKGAPVPADEAFANLGDMVGDAVRATLGWRGTMPLGILRQSVNLWTHGTVSPMSNNLQRLAAALKLHMGCDRGNWFWHFDEVGDGRCCT